MSSNSYPKFFSERIFSNEDVLKQTVKSGTCVASGFATSEPLAFHHDLWDHIQAEDITDLEIKNALYMAPHKVCVGDALQSKGKFYDFAKKASTSSIIGNLARKANAITQKTEGLGKLVDHYRELKERRIVFTSPFISGATNIIIPANALTRSMYPEFVNRNTTRMGITHMQSIHFPDAVDSMGYSPEGEPMVDTFAAPCTPPDENGDMSHALANGANGEIVEKVIKDGRINLILYVNPKLPFTRGYNDAKNTFNINELEMLANNGKLFVVEDDGKIPALPANSLGNPLPAEEQIAQHVVNHIEMNGDYTNGRAIQVGFGGTGVLAIKGLKDSSWTGRSYTEMMEPFTMDLFEAGKISGSHFIEKDGTRTQLDGKMVCTFTICEEGDDFYQKINNNPNLIVAAASRVVIPEGFYYGLGINNCLAVDFHGHVSSGGRGKNHHSGVGGGAQIFRGLSKGGLGYLCMKATHKNFAGKLRSSIFPFLPEGTPISHIGPDLMGGRDGARFFLVTEYGVARLSGQNQHQFIKNIISVADPQFRDWLKYMARKEFGVNI